MPHTVIGVLGGTFDPIHNGHLAIASHVLHEIPCDHIEFIPGFQPPHRNQPRATPAHRLAMTTLATQTHSQFHVNSMEMQRKGVSYSVDTLTTLRQQMPDASLCFIVGADAFSKLNEWKAWEKIPQLAHLIVVSRPKATLPKAAWLSTLLLQHKTDNKNDLSNTTSGKIYFLPIEPVMISATQIRADILAGKKDIPELPIAVQHYIALHRVFSSV